MAKATGLVAAVLVGLFLTVTPAQGHTGVRSTTPADGSVLSTAPAEIVIVLTATPQSVAEMTVTGPGGSAVAVPARLDGPRIVAPLLPPTAAGLYTVAFRVIAEDGHVLSRQIRFTLTARAVATPARPSTSSATPPAPSVTPTAAGAAPSPGTPSLTASSSTASVELTASTIGEGGGAPGWVWVAGFGTVLVILVGAALLTLRQLSRDRS